MPIPLPYDADDEAPTHRQITIKALENGWLVEYVDPPEDDVDDTEIPPPYMWGVPGVPLPRLRRPRQPTTGKLVFTDLAALMAWLEQACALPSATKEARP